MLMWDWPELPMMAASINTEGKSCWNRNRPNNPVCHRVREARWIAPQKSEPRREAGKIGRENVFPVIARLISGRRADAMLWPYNVDESNPERTLIIWYFQHLTLNAHLKFLEEGWKIGRILTPRHCSGTVSTCHFGFLLTDGQYAGYAFFKGSDIRLSGGFLI